MQPSHPTIEILKGIRDEVRSTNSRIDETNTRRDTMREDLSGRIEAMREELSGRIEGLSTRIVESEIRTSTAITDLAGTMREMTSVLRVQHDLRPRVERCERDIDDLRRRLGP